MVKDANMEIKLAAKNAGVYHWQIADRLGIQDSAFSRRLRRELPQEEKARILTIINDLATEKAGVS